MSVASGDLRACLRYQAGWIWHEQNDAFNYGLSLQEETLTEMLLLRIARDCAPLGLSVRLFTRNEEGGRRVYKKDQHGNFLVGPTRKKVIDPVKSIRGNGADWEWYFDHPLCKVGFRVQAKRLYSNPVKPGYYGGLDPNSSQTKDLIDAACAVSFNPIYVFYNHPRVQHAALFGRGPAPDWFGMSQWGCSVATADFVSKAKSKALAKLKKGMLPWHRFFGFGKTCRPALAMRSMAGEQEFVWAEERPDWLALLLADASDPDGVRDRRLNEILSERGLDGVAYFQPDDFDEPEAIRNFGQGG